MGFRRNPVRLSLVALLLAACSSLPVDDPEEACRLAADLLEGGRLEEALDLAAAARSRWPRHERAACLWAYAAMAQALAGKGPDHALLDEAERTCAAAAVRGGVESLFALGLVRRNRGDLDGALRAWQEGWKRDPGHRRTLEALADLHFDLGRERAAARFYRELDRIPPPRARVCYRLALCAAARVDSAPEPAVADYAKAGVGRLLDRVLELEPDHAGALRTKAWLLLRLSRLRGRWSQPELRREDAAAAGKLLRRALVADPGSAPILHALGWIASECGKTDEAEDYLRRAVAADPGFAPALADLAALLEGSGRGGPGEVERLRRRARRETGDPQLLRALERARGRPGGERGGGA